MLLIGAIASHLRPWAYSSLIKFVNCFLLGRFRARKPCQSFQSQETLSELEEEDEEAVEMDIFGNGNVSER